MSQQQPTSDGRPEDPALPGAHTSDAGHALDAPIDVFSDEFVEAAADLDPLLATYLGLPGRDHLMTDFSPDGFAARAEATRATLAALDALPLASRREQVAAAAMRERLGADHAYGEAGLDRALNVIASPMQGIRETFDLLPFETVEQRLALVRRLQAVPAALLGYRRTLLAEAAAGRPPARRQVQACAGMARGWVTDHLFADLAARVAAEVGDSEGAFVADLNRAAPNAESAYADFADFLSDELTGRAREFDGVGHDVYSVASRMFLGADVDPYEAYDWGWEELGRITAEMSATAREIIGRADVAEAKDALGEDPKRHIEGVEAFRDWMQAQADEAISALDGTHFDIPEPIRRLECRLAPTHDGGIYYTGPSEDFTRPGRMWWSVPSGQERFATWLERTTVYHEGVPGHHLQVGQTVVRADLLNRYQRLLCWVSGHGEGWALYAERLMGELGFLDDPGDRLGMLDGQQLRAARVVVDIGCHLGLRIPSGLNAGRPWDAATALAFLRQHSSVGDTTLRFELNRYLGWPGQAPSYKLGERLWRQARQDVQARKGADFDLKAFHSAALNLGSLGLDPLRAALAEL